jgi:hypothetical protein
MLMSMTFNKDAPASLRNSYNLHLQKMDKQANEAISVYERQQINQIVTDGREQYQKALMQTLPKSLAIPLQL